MRDSRSNRSSIFPFPFYFLLIICVILDFLVVFCSSRINFLHLVFKLSYFSACTLHMLCLSFFEFSAFFLLFLYSVFNFLHAILHFFAVSIFLFFSLHPLFFCFSLNFIFLFFYFYSNSVFAQRTKICFLFFYKILF